MTLEYYELNLIPGLELSIDTPKDTLVGKLDFTPPNLNATGNVNAVIEQDNPYFYFKDGNVYTKYSGIKMFQNKTSIEFAVNVQTPAGDFPVVYSS